MERKKEKLKKALKKHEKYHIPFFEALAQIHHLSEEIYGFSYGDEDIDEIIDSIDYGQGGMSFEYFNDLMENEKKDFKK